MDEKGPVSAAHFVILAFNEAKNIAPLCREICRQMADFLPNFRIFVVNDGSTDETKNIVENLSQTFPVTCLTHQSNRGVSAAFITGFKAALEKLGPHDAVIAMEGDGTSDPAALAQILEKLKDSCDVVVASRYAGKGGYRYFPLKRWALSQGANRLLRLIYPLPPIRDYTIFYRAYRADVLRKGFERYGDRLMTTGGFACNAELLLKLRPFIRKAGEVPLTYDYSRKKSTSGMKIFENLKSYWKLLRLGPEPR